MKAISIAVFIGLSGVFVGFGLSRLALDGGSPELGSDQKKSPEVLYWVAPMDANFRRDEPGLSPMGMALMPVYKTELSGGIYFGEPRGIRILENGEKQGYNTYVYAESEIKRIGRVAFESAQKRGGRLCSVDKANVLEVTGLWRSVMSELTEEYPDVELTHMYVDNAAMQLIREPKQFDVIVTGNMFGDILSDSAAMLTGSIGMLPSASLDKESKGMYEPIHGSAPDIAGLNIANPLATILSLAMMMRYSLDLESIANKIEYAVGAVLDKNLRTADIFSNGTSKLTTTEMGQAVINELD